MSGFVDCVSPGVASVFWGDREGDVSGGVEGGAMIKGE